MKKVVNLALTILLTFSIALLSFSTTTNAATEYYPGTKVKVSAGDVLYSSKGFDSYFVGHVAIVGNDGKIYHSTPAVSSGAIGESLTDYLKRFSTDPIRVYRYNPKGQMGPFLEPTNAGKWAQNNYSKVEKYSILGTVKMNDVTKNYCSKFVWQAYKFGANVSIDTPYHGHYMSPDAKTFFAPSEINFSQGSNASIFIKVADFKTKK